MSQSLTHATVDFGRRDFTLAEFLDLERRGIIDDADNLELVDGEIIPMQAKTHWHELFKTFLMLEMARALPDDLWMGVESSMYLSERTLLEPDLVVYRRGLTLEEVQGPDLILAVEIALTSLTFDLGRKSALYARHGVRELWVVDAQRRSTHVHRGPDGNRWTAVDLVAPDGSLTHPALPSLSVRLDTV